MSKRPTFSLEQLADIFKALGNAHRLRILVSLSECCHPGRQCCGGEARLPAGELGSGLEIVASTLSHHIKELDRAGLLDCCKRGKFLMCCIDRSTLKSLSGLFAALADGGPLPEEWTASASQSPKE